MTDTALPQRASLKARVLRAGGWTLGAQILSQVLRLASNVIVARLLSPDVFGIMGMVYVLMTGLTLFSDVGTGIAAVQSARGKEPIFLRTAFAMQVVRSALLAVVTGLLAVGVSIGADHHLFSAGTVYANPLMPWVLGAFAFLTLLSGLESMRAFTARRELQMRQLVQLDLIAQVASAVVMVLLAWWTRSIFALVAGAFVSCLLRVVLTHTWLPGERDGFAWERAAVSEMLRFAKWILPSSILGYLAINGDRLWLGGLISHDAFNFYAVAFGLISAQQTMSNMLCTQVAFPALSEVHRERPHMLGHVLTRFQWLYDGIAVTICAAIWAAHQPIIDVLYDDRYRDAGPMLGALAVGAIGLRSQIAEQAYNAIGQPKFNTLNSLLRLVALAVGILWGHHLGGAMGAIWGIALSQFSGWPLAAWFKWRHGALTWRSEAVLPLAIAAGAFIGWLAGLLAHAVMR